MLSTSTCIMYKHFGTSRIYQIGTIHTPYLFWMFDFKIYAKKAKMQKRQTSKKMAEMQKRVKMHVQFQKSYQKKSKNAKKGRNAKGGVYCKNTTSFLNNFSVWVYLEDSRICLKKYQIDVDGTDVKFDGLEVVNLPVILKILKYNYYTIIIYIYYIFIIYILCWQFSKKLEVTFKGTVREKGFWAINISKFDSVISFSRSKTVFQKNTSYGIIYTV